MSKCRYDLSEDCYNKDCLACILDKIRAEILQVANQEKFHDAKWALGLRYAVNIIDKYKLESEGKE